MNSLNAEICDSGDTVKRLHARRILDSRGNWTIEAEIESVRGHFGAGSAPSGASVGSHEAVVIDAEKEVRIANALSSKIKGVEFSQKSIDDFLLNFDKTKSFSKIGGNTAIAVSFAAYNALSALNRPHVRHVSSGFPYPLGNVFGGGKHGGSMDFQEVLVCPAKAKTFPQAVEKMARTYHEFKAALQKKAGKNNAVGINDEGALSAKIPFEKAMDALFPIAEGNGCRVGLDIAASSLWNGKKYAYNALKKSLDSGSQMDFISDLIKTYGFFYVEDPFHEDDFESFSALLKKRGGHALICADDLTATNAGRLADAIGKKSINAAIVKPNQIGTVSLAREFTFLAFKNAIMPVVSHRSGETADSTISLLSVNWKVPIIKAGVVDMRVSKLDRLLELWDGCEKPRMNKLWV